MSELLLDVKGLTIQFGDLTAVNNVSFQLAKGETLGIVGESGSGKSVTSLSVMRLLPPAAKIVSGSVHLNSKQESSADLFSLPENRMRKFRGNDMAMIFQEPMTSLNPVFTCGHQVAEAIRIHQKVSSGQAKEQVLQLFQQVLLPRPEKIYAAYPHQLSGGQKQRVMIAMAMANQPSLLIADEPTTALDVTVQKTILELMAGLRDTYGMGMMFITHDLGVISELADRVLVMYKGSVVEEGPVKEIFRNPQHPYTKGLLACRPPMGYRLSQLPVVSDFLKEASGEMKESGTTVEEIRNIFMVNDEHRRQRLAKLYASKPLLKIENLSTWYPIRRKYPWNPREYVKAVDDISLEVYPGETLGLVGESGCGKTTLGRTVLRLIEPTAGKIWFEGKEITALSPAELRKKRKEMQIIFQDPYSSLNPRMTIGEAITEPIRVHRIFSTAKECRQRAVELLERVGLSEAVYYRYPHEFSGGQRQRIVIARALGLNPRFIICDESVSALDVSVQAQVLNLLNELKRDFGFTYIFISHDLSVVKFMSDRMVVMNKGRIEEMGDADAVYANPRSEYTRRLIDAVPG